MMSVSGVRNSCDKLVKELQLSFAESLLVLTVFLLDGERCLKQQL